MIKNLEHYKQARAHPNFTFGELAKLRFIATFEEIICLTDLIPTGDSFDGGITLKANSRLDLYKIVSRDHPEIKKLYVELETAKSNPELLYGEDSFKKMQEEAIKKLEQARNTVQMQYDTLKAKLDFTKDEEARSNILNQMTQITEKQLPDLDNQYACLLGGSHITPDLMSTITRQYTNKIILLTKQAIANSTQLLNTIREGRVYPLEAYDAPVPASIRRILPTESMPTVPVVANRFHRMLYNYQQARLKIKEQAENRARAESSLLDPSQMEGLVPQQAAAPAKNPEGLDPSLMEGLTPVKIDPDKAESIVESIEGRYADNPEQTVKKL